MLLIKNGTVIDPANGVTEALDVAISDGIIAGVGHYSESDGDQVIDASHSIVTPGLIDHHAHLYPMAGIGIPAEAICFRSGVTTVVDAGSTGCATFPIYQPFIRQSKLCVKAYLNVCSTGLSSLPEHMEQVAPEHYDERAIRDVFERYGQDLLGLKLRTSREIVGELGYTPLRETVRLADKLNVPVMIHCTNPPGTIAELLEYLRPGDVITHMYMNKGETLLDEWGAVCKAAYTARQRGVLFEAADAREHFSFEISEPAIREGFYPDIIATDLTKFSMNLRPTAFSMANQLSKYYYLGIPLEDVIARCTSRPAKYMGLADRIGSLTPGAQADLAIFRVKEQDVEFGDRPYQKPEKQLRHGTKRICPVLTMKGGEVVFRDEQF
ncbi:amidohydrolase family protein [Caproicibacterium sp. NSD3]